MAGKKKDTDPHGIYASMDLVYKISKMPSAKGARYCSKEESTNNALRLNHLIIDAKKISDKFKNDYDKTGGKL